MNNYYEMNRKEYLYIYILVQSIAKGIFQESRCVLVVVYYRGPPACLEEGDPVTNQDPTLYKT